MSLFHISDFLPTFVLNCMATKRVCGLSVVVCIAIFAFLGAKKLVSLQDVGYTLLNADRSKLLRVLISDVLRRSRRDGHQSQTLVRLWHTLSTFVGRCIDVAQKKFTRTSNGWDGSKSISQCAADFNRRAFSNNLVFTVLGPVAVVVTIKRCWLGSFRSVCRATRIGYATVLLRRAYIVCSRCNR